MRENHLIKNSLATLNPEVAKQWHSSKNGDLTPEKVTCGSGRKVWWKCPKGEDHEWKTTVAHRNNGKGCPICSGHKVARSTSIATLKPELAKQWHPTKNDKLLPEHVSPGSSKKVWWKCPKGEDHEWEAMVANRSKGSGCPICTNHKAVDSNSLANVYPELAKQWHPTKNGTLTPNDVSYGTNKKVWWKCHKSKNHVWLTSPSSRIIGTGCPFCKNPSSAPELKIYSELKTVFPSAQHRVIISGHEVDIFIPEINVGIEYDGEFWHRKKQKQDLIKNEILKDKIILIRVRDIGLPLLTDNDVKQTTRNISIHTIKNILQVILKLNRIQSTEVLGKIDEYCRNTSWVASEHYRILLSEKNHITFTESISNLFPEVIKEWDSIKNEPLKPDFFTPGSNVKVWWKCPKGDDHEWEATIVGRCLNNVGCPICANKKIVASNCIATLNSELAGEWHPTKNGKLTPYNVGVGSNRKIWWKCPIGDDHEWKTAVTHRNDRGQGCPICSNKKIVASNCLATLNPELSKQWHPTKNGKLTPYNVGVGSNKSAWWKCPKGDDHEWYAVIINRHNGIGCPICSNQKVVYSNSLEKLNPELAKEWHPTKNRDLKVSDVGFGSRTKVWWKCPKGDDHEWQTSVRNRKKGDGCPICSNRKVVRSNSLANFSQELAKEWNVIKNTGITSGDVVPSSSKIVWWKGACGHEWQAAIKERAIGGQGCPECIEQKKGQLSLFMKNSKN
jgi:hypothetical protein